ncbi:hypothetical protein THAOC_24112 [Thalassiosira oceanica]|uniref:Uncharacterized protein n=1 Tax=Thalassiosira oceanica TaxID=159749 RepID=K0SBF5_THAOC|nr:hypothetical protein THAOC_24112 [Thalassiosira oceanica]|eukprot:EJK56067.1 hypothetical protein THAOC_24112 [Thalassiosira oceanica]
MRFRGDVCRDGRRDEGERGVLARRGAVVGRGDRRAVVRAGEGRLLPGRLLDGRAGHVAQARIAAFAVPVVLAGRGGGAVHDEVPAERGGPGRAAHGPPPEQRRALPAGYDAGPRASLDWRGDGAVHVGRGARPKASFYGV